MQPITFKDIVFLYNYDMHVWDIKEGDGYRFGGLLKQAEIDVQSTSNRKLPNFYEKVTDFLWESYRISKWWQNHVFTGAWRDCHNRTIQTCGTSRLFIQPNWLFMQKRVWVWHAYIKHRTFWFTYQNRLILYLEWCKQEILSNAYTKTLKTPYIFSEPTACLKFR